MTVETAKNLLPSIGDKRSGGIVVEVNRAHLWYRVQKIVNGSKISECHKVPASGYVPIVRKAETPDELRKARTAKSVRCVNTGRVFRTNGDAAKAYGLTKYQIQMSARRGVKVGDGVYLFEYVPYIGGGKHAR